MICGPREFVPIPQHNTCLAPLTAVLGVAGVGCGLLHHQLPLDCIVGCQDRAAGYWQAGHRTSNWCRARSSSPQLDTVLLCCGDTPRLVSTG